MGREARQPRLVPASTLGEKWAEFYEGTGLATKPEVMVEELRRAFYSGGQSMMGLAIERGGEPAAETAEEIQNLLPVLLQRHSAHWQTYVDRILTPAGANGEQIYGTALAFMGGGVGMFALFMVAVEPDDEGECERNMKALQAELDDYLRLFERRHGL